MAGKYKSLGSFETEELSKFCVITGKNGTGKSQLIEVIQKQFRNPNPSDTSHVFKLSIDPKPLNTQFEGLQIENSTIASGQVWSQKVKAYSDQYLKCNTETKSLIEELCHDKIEFRSFSAIAKGIDDYMAKHGTDNLRNIAISLGIVTPQQRDSEMLKRSLNHFFHQMGLAITLTKVVAAYKNKEMTELEENDFMTTIYPETLIEPDFIFLIRIESLFYNYARNRNQNDQAFFRKERYHKANDSISDLEFIKTFLPPWVAINQIFERHQIPFIFKGIEPEDFGSESVHNIRLIKQPTGTPVDFASLSSGEKVIMGLVIKLFLSSHYGEQLSYPDYIFLDEPDAHLHPEMSKLLIDVLRKSFVEQLGIDVLLTTHSPSTIALAPEDCIYEIQNEPETKISKISKDDALKILTGNIPTLSIDYKNHRQVFVESPTDLKYYQALFTKLRNQGITIFNLYFITLGNGKGNCDQVLRMTDDIRSSGNKTAFGVIDWDSKNDPSEFVRVHGHKLRYSIENFLFDPIYIAVLLLEANGAHGIYEAGYDEYSSHDKIGEEPTEKLQKTIDWIIEKIIAVFPEFSKGSSINAAYANGINLKIPQAYLHMNGHLLEEKIYKVFPALKGKYIQKGAMTNKLIEIIIRSYPFVPKESYDILYELSNPSTQSMLHYSI